MRVGFVRVLWHALILLKITIKFSDGDYRKLDEQLYLLGRKNKQINYLSIADREK
jgi:hypothetical protein